MTPSNMETICDMPMYKNHLSYEELRASQQLEDFINFCSPNEAVEKQLTSCLTLLMTGLIK